VRSAGDSAFPVIPRCSPTVLAREWHTPTRSTERLWTGAALERVIMAP
jgi:hypothetical protein